MEPDQTIPQPPPLLSAPPEAEAVLKVELPRPRRRLRIGILVRVLFWACVLSWVGWLAWSKYNEKFEYDEKVARWKARVNEEDAETESKKLISRLDVMVPEAEPAFKDEQVEQWVREIRPLVEEVCERQFRNDPIVKTADRAALRESLKKDFKAQGRVLQSIMGQNVDSVLVAQADLLAAALLGKYGFVDKTLYVAPRNMFPLFEFTGVDHELAEPIAKLVIAHELTHAMQDQYTDLSKSIENCRDIEEMQAFNATIEGHAVMIQEMVGKKLQLDEATLELSRLLSAGAVNSGHVTTDVVMNMIQNQYTQTYIGGRDFMQYQFQHGGMNHVWEVMASPPKQTSMIAEPATYGVSNDLDGIDFHALLENLESFIGDGPWTSRNMQIGQMLLRSFYGSFSQEIADDIISRITRAQTVLFLNDANNSLASATIFTLKQDGDSAEIVKLLEQAAKDNFAKAQAGESPEVTDLQINEFKGIDADLAQQISIQVSQGGGRTQGQNIVRIARGKLMFEFIFAGVEMDDERIIKLAQELFRRFDAANKQSFNIQFRFQDGHYGHACTTITDACAGQMLREVA